MGFAPDWGCSRLFRNGRLCFLQEQREWEGERVPCSVEEEEREREEDKEREKGILKAKVK